MSSRRLVDERHRDHHALAHAAGELVRVVVDPAFGPRDPDLLQRLERARLGFLLRDVLVEEDPLDDLGTDLVHRVQRRHRVLEDHRDVVAADLAQSRRRGLQQVLAAEERPPLAGRRLLGVQAHDRQAGDALARARLADDAERLALADRERDAVDRLDDAVVRLEVGLEVVDLEERLRHQLRRIRGSMKA